MTRPSDGIKGHSSGWTTIAYSEELDCVITGGTDGVVRVWSGGARGALGQHLSIHGTGGGSVTCLASTMGAVFRASGGLAVEVHQVLNVTGVVRLSEFRKRVTCLRLSNDGTRLVAGGADCRVKLISFNPDKLSMILRGTTYSAPDGVRAGETVFRGHTGPVVSVAINCTNDMVASSSLDGSVRVWDAFTALPLKQIRLGTSLTNLSDCRLTWNPEMSQILVIPLLKEIVWLDCVGFVIEAAFKWSAISSQRITDCAFSPCGFYLCGATADGCIIVWSTIDCSLLMSFRSPRQAGISGMLWHPKQQHLILFTDVLGYWQTVEIDVLKLPSLDSIDKSPFLTADAVIDYLSNSCCRPSPYRPKRFYPREIDQNSIDLSNIDIDAGLSVDVDLDFDLALDLCLQCAEATSMQNLTTITLSHSNKKQIEINRDPLLDVELQEIFPFVSSPSPSQTNVMNIEPGRFQVDDGENTKEESQDIERDQIDITGQEFNFGLLDDTGSTDANNVGFGIQNSANPKQFDSMISQFDRFMFYGYPRFQLPTVSTATVFNGFPGNCGCRPGLSVPYTLPFMTKKKISFGKENDWRIVKGSDTRLLFDNSREREWYCERTNKENIPFVDKYSGRMWNNTGARENNYNNITFPDQSYFNKQFASSSSNCRMGRDMLKDTRNTMRANESGNKFRRKIQMGKNDNQEMGRTFFYPMSSSLHLKTKKHSVTTNEYPTQKHVRR